MRTGWVDSIPNVLDGGRIAVARNPQGQDYGAVDMSSPPKGCMHTTEGSSLPAYGGNAPHFTIAKDKLYQHRALGRMAGTLQNLSGGVETNRLIRIQFELVGFSQMEPWLPGPVFQRDALASLFEFAERELGVPEDHVFPDDLGGGTWATASNPRRRSGKFPGTPGWYGHVEIPENSHWDPGSLMSSKLMANEPTPPLVDAFTLMVSFAHKHDKDEVHRHALELSPKFSTEKELRAWTVKDRELRGKVWRALRGKITVDGNAREVNKPRIHVAHTKVKPGAVR